MELITILNRCHRFRGFVYQHAHFSADKKSIEVAVRPRKGSAAVCSRCHLPAPGYDQIAERRFELIPLWGFLVFLLYPMRRVNCRRCGIVAVEEVPWGDGKRTLTKAYMLFLARWARRMSWKETAEAFRTSWDKVFDAVEHVVTFGLEHRVLGQIDAIGVYLDLLLHWNRTVSLTSVTDPREIVSRHFGESMFAGSILPLSQGGRLADVGSGAGFPGLPLKIAFPSLELSLIEPNLKKSAFLKEAIGLLHLESVEVIRKPYSAVEKERRWDFISSRALGDYRLLLRWAATVLNQPGHIVLWVGQEDSLLITKAEGWKWSIPHKIPESDRRYILIGTTAYD